MSGDIAAWPFSTRESVCRATPRMFAASVTLRSSTTVALDFLRHESGLITSVHSYGQCLFA